MTWLAWGTKTKAEEKIMLWLIRFITGDPYPDSLLRFTSGLLVTHVETSQATVSRWAAIPSSCSVTTILSTRWYEVSV